MTILEGMTGMLRYRGYPIEELASSFELYDVAHLSLFESLPSHYKLQAFLGLPEDRKVARLSEHVSAVVRTFPNLSKSHESTCFCTNMVQKALPHLNPAIAKQAVNISTSNRADAVPRVLCTLPTLAAAILQ